MRQGLACAVLLWLGSCAAGRTASGTENETQATIGIETRAPTEREAEELGLSFKVRQQGRVVTRVSEPAAGAGIRPGDVLCQADGIDLYSQDDLDDAVRARRPGDGVALVLERTGEDIVHVITVKLGSERGPAAHGIAWRHASLAHLPSALAEARATGKNVLVGLSGAET